MRTRHATAVLITCSFAHGALCVWRGRAARAFGADLFEPDALEHLDVDFDTLAPAATIGATRSRPHRRAKRSRPHRHDRRSRPSARIVYCPCRASQSARETSAVSRLYLGYISAVYRLYLRRISVTSRLHLGSRAPVHSFGPSGARGHSSFGRAGVVVRGVGAADITKVEPAACAVESRVKAARCEARRWVGSRLA